MNHVVIRTKRSQSSNLQAPWGNQNGRFKSNSVSETTRSAWFHIENSVFRQSQTPWYTMLLSTGKLIVVFATVFYECPSRTTRLHVSIRTTSCHSSTQHENPINSWWPSISSRKKDRQQQEAVKPSTVQQTYRLGGMCARGKRISTYK